MSDSGRGWESLNEGTGYSAESYSPPAVRQQPRRSLSELQAQISQKQRDKQVLQNESARCVAAVRQCTAKVAEVDALIRKTKSMNWLQLKLSGLKPDKLRWDLEREQRALQEASMHARDASEKAASVEREIQRLKREADTLRASHGPAQSEPFRREA